jgi:alpha-mannosidase
VAKTLGHKEFVSSTNARKFGEIRGNFYNDGGFHSSADQPATITILENGPIRVRVAVAGTIDSNSFTHVMTVTQGQKPIDMHLQIDWKNNPRVGGDFGQKPVNGAQSPPSRTSNQRAFYDDRYKLLALFPLNFKSEKIYKNAPFDVTESKLTDTFFDTWDGIKNNIILNWVDVLDSSDDYGMALLTDHTTSYAHGADFPLGLTLQYCGTGLWGRDYTITGPLDVSYALVPHSHRWDRAGLWQESDNWNRPLAASLTHAELSPGDYQKSLIDATGTGLEISAVYFQGNDLIVRLFNAEGDASPKTVFYNGLADQAQLVELNGNVTASLAMSKNEKDRSFVRVTLPRFGIRTIKFSNARG